MPDPETAEVPIVVNDSKLVAQLVQFATATAFIVTSYPVITAFVGKRDLVGLIDFLKSEPALQAMGVLCAFALLIQRQFAARHRVAKSAAIAKSSPIAVLKSEVAADPSLARARETEAAAPATSEWMPLTRLVSLSELARARASEEVTFHYDNGTPVEGLAPPTSAKAPGAEVDDSNDVTELKDAIEAMPEYERCELPPVGWFCTRIKGHTGPCATVRDTTVVLPAAKGEL